MIYWRRDLAEMFARVRTQFPAVMVTGPRQSGKTTFLRHEAGDCAYVTLDDPLQRRFARDDPNGFLDAQADRPVILDEIQYAPELFSYIKMRIDADTSRRGGYLMTGSQQFQMMRHVSDSLAGRLAIMDLLPFSARELRAVPARDIQTAIWLGGYPAVQLDPGARETWMSSYVQTYLERDVRQLQNIRSLNSFEQYLGLCAGRHGCLMNRAELAKECGVSQPTIREWESVLTASYIVYLLPPYHTNFGKRLIKAPKAYFLDSGLAAFLTRQPAAESLWRGAAGGAFMEGWVVSEAVKAAAARGKRSCFYFWRSQDGTEVDLIVESGGNLHGVEIKQTASPASSHADGLRRWRRIVGEDRVANCILVCTAGNEVTLPGDIRAVPWRLFPDWISDVLGH